MRDYQVDFKDEIVLQAYSDASFSPEGSESHGSFLILLEGSPIFWRAGRQSLVTLSTAESEMTEVIEAMAAGESIAVMVQELYEVVIKVAYTDSQAAEAILTCDGGSWRTRHLRLRSSFARQSISRGDWLIQHVAGESMIADLGLSKMRKAEKSHGHGKFERSRKKGGKKHCTRVRVHARTLKSVKAAKPQSRKAAMERSSRKAAKPQSRHGTRKPQSRKAAKPPSRHGTRKPQSRKAAKPQSRQAAKPPSRRAASSATHAPLPAFIAATLPPPWIAEAAKPQSRKAAKPQALRRRRRLLCSSPLCCQSVKKRQRAAKRQGVKAPRSVKAAKLQEASRSVKKRQEASMLQEAAQRRSVKDPPTKGWLCLEGDGLAYGKRSATKGWLCLEGDGLAYCETIRSEFRRAMADVMATPKRLKSSIRLNEWQFSFLFG